MQLKKIKTRVTKRKLTKCGVCRTYSDIAYRFATLLEEDCRVKEFACNVELNGVLIGKEPKAYTTDFYITYCDGSIAVRECVQRDMICKPRNIKLLETSKDYWEKNGVTDWGIVTNKEGLKDE